MTFVWVAMFALGFLLGFWSGRRIEDRTWRRR